jgi:hypothetical protein
MMTTGVDSNGTNNNERAPTMLTITIETDNAAFQDDPAGELAHILGKVAERAPMTAEGTVSDTNGNTVGAWAWPGGAR